MNQRVPLVNKSLRADSFIITQNTNLTKSPSQIISHSPLQLNVSHLKNNSVIYKSNQNIPHQQMTPTKYLKRSNNQMPPSFSPMVYTSTRQINKSPMHSNNNGKATRNPLSYENEIKHLRQQLNEKQEQIDTLAASQNKASVYLKEKLFEVNKVNDSLEDKFQQMVTIIDQKDNEIKFMQKEYLANNDHQFNNSNQQNNILKESLDKLTHQNNQISKENLNFKNQYNYDQEIIDQLQGQLNMMKDQEKDKYHQFDQQLNQNNNQHKSMNQSLQKTEQENIQLSNENRNMKQTIEIYKGQLNQQSNGDLDQQLISLQNEKSQLQFDYEYKFQKQEKVLQQYLDRISYLEDQAGELVQELQFQKTDQQNVQIHQ